MRTVFVSFYEGYPPSSGAASVTYNCAKHAPGERFLIQVGGRESDGVSPDGVRMWTIRGARSRVGKLVGLRRRIRRIVLICKGIEPDVVVLEGASWVFYHWLLMRQLRQAIPGAVIVYHAHNVEYVLRKQKHGRLVTAITRWAERRVFREADIALAVSEVDQRQVEQLYGIRPQLLPNGVDTEQFGRVSEAEVKAIRAKYGLNDPTVLFMGFYAYRPNTEAIDLLVNQIFPIVHRRRADVKLAVLGGRIPHIRPWILNPGSIPYEELPAFVSACSVGVAPIVSGSGTRLKILEYLAAGLPVVSTPKGAEGLDLRHGEHLLIAQDDRTFADALIKLLDGPGAAELGSQGRAFVREHYSWPRIMADCRAIIERRLAVKEEHLRSCPVG